MPKKEYPNSKVFSISITKQLFDRMERERKRTSIHHEKLGHPAVTRSQWMTWAIEHLAKTQDKYFTKKGIDYVD
jgi:hypothetical protein